MQIRQSKLFSGLAILALTFFLQACGHHHHSAEPIAEGKALNLALDNGQKWHMDKHTRSVLADMKGKASVVDADSATSEQLKALGATLNADLKTLIDGCTMEGDAHNALHEFLVSFMPAVEQLETAGEPGALRQVQSLLNSYGGFFH